MQLSVIIPLAPQEVDLTALSDSLIHLPNKTEIIIVRSNACAITTLPFTLTNQSVYLVTSEKTGRAQQMNMGANMAKGDFLWFLHADSYFDSHAVGRLLHSINPCFNSNPSTCPYLKQANNSLYYFDLKFLPNGTPLMRCNEWGVLFRSRVLKMPFGDQGLCLKKQLFEACGPYQENLSYGEDHMLVWQAHHYGLSVRSVKAPLYTSARKYTTKGWLTTTSQHLYLWAKQAMPQVIIYLKGCINNSSNT